MDKKEYGSYEDVHAMLVEAMQEACTKDESGQYQSPNIDMSFLYEEDTPKKKKPFRTNRFTKVAAIIIMVLLGMNVVMLATDSGEVYSEKGLLHRIYEGARGIFTDEDQSEFVEMDELEEIFIAKTIDEIEEAKKFCTGLYVPDYIPKLYEFESLEVDKYISGDYFFEYKFESKDGLLIVSSMCLSDERKDKSFSKGRIVELSDRLINVYWDKKYNTYIADIYFDDLTINIYGNLSIEEMTRIATNLNK